MSYPLRFLVGCVLSIFAIDLSAAREASLPPLDCVHKLREARIVNLRGDSTTSLELMMEAVEQYPNELVPLLALWEHHQTERLSPKEAQRLRGLLTDRLSNPDSSLPPSMLRYLVENPSAEIEELELILHAAVQRLETLQKDTRLLEIVALLQRRLGRVEESRETLGRLLAVAPTTTTRWHCVALDQELEHWTEAAANLRVLVEQDDLPYIRLSYIEALGKAGMYDELVRQFETLDEPGLARDVTYQTTYRSLLVQVAWDLRDAGKPVQAETVFRRLLAIDPADAAARAAILHLYSSEEDRRRHEASLKQQWDEESDPVRLLEEGATLLASGDAAAAFDLLNRASQSLPDDEVAWFNLGLCAIRLEKWEHAAVALEHAIRISPDRAELHLNRGIALQQLDRCPDAIESLNRALELDSSLAQSHYYLYVCHTALNDLPSANEHRKLYDASR